MSGRQSLPSSLGFRKSVTSNPRSISSNLHFQLYKLDITSLKTDMRVFSGNLEKGCQTSIANLGTPKIPYFSVYFTSLCSTPVQSNLCIPFTWWRCLCQWRPQSLPLHCTGLHCSALHCKAMLCTELSCTALC